MFSAIESFPESCYVTSCGTPEGSIGIKSLYKPLDYSQHNYYTVNLSDSRKTGDENAVRKESDKLESLQILYRKR